MGVTPMGFEVEDTEIDLVFPDGRWKGAVITARCSMTIGEYLDYLKARNADPEADPEGYIRRLYEQFTNRLVSWNLQKKGEPIPCDFEGFWSLERGFQQAIVRAWAEAVAEPSIPLGEPSNGGRPSAELSMPMAPLSESQAS